MTRRTERDNQIADSNAECGLDCGTRRPCRFHDSPFDVVSGSRSRKGVIPAAVSLVVVLAGVLRFYGLAWGAPYFHFHIDEHFVFVGADRLRVSMEAAAMSGKFFMYGPLPMHLLNAVVWVYEGIRRRWR